jgi:hypothetical protein
MKVMYFDWMGIRYRKQVTETGWDWWDGKNRLNKIRSEIIEELSNKYPQFVDYVEESETNNNKDVK